MGKKLVSLVILKPKTAGGNGFYKAIKLFDDGSSDPVSQEQIDFAVDWMRQHGYRPHGFWLNDAPAVVFAVSRQDFIIAWNAPKTLLPCPCTYRDRAWHEERRRGNYVLSSATWFGERGVIVPTRTACQIQALRARYSWYQGDLAFVPQEYLDALEQELRRRAEFTANICKRAMAMA